MLARLIASIATGEVSGVVGQIRRKIIFFTVAGVFAACGVGFLLGAVYIWAARRWGDIEAAVGIGVIFFALALLIVVIQKISSRVKARRLARRRSTDVNMLAGAAALAILPSLLSRTGILGGVVAPLAAVAAYAIYRENRRPRADDFGPED